MFWASVLIVLMLATLGASRWARMPWSKALFVTLLVPPILSGSVGCLAWSALFLLSLCNDALRELGCPLSDGVLCLLAALVAVGVMLWVAWLFFSDERSHNAYLAAQREASRAPGEMKE